MGFKAQLEKCFRGHGLVDIVASNPNMLLLVRIPKYHKYMWCRAWLDKCFCGFGFVDIGWTKVAVDIVL